MKKLCDQAGLSGKYTNHSLRATCATRLFQAGVDEQLIKSVTGHRSEAVQDYKRENPKLISEAQKKVSCTVTRPEFDPDKPLPKLSEFDIDDVKIGKPEVEYVVGDKSSRSHKNPCLRGECGNLCEVVKQIDEMSRVKKLKLSLKYRKKSDK